MDLYSNEQYVDDVRYVAEMHLPWEKLQDKTILLSGCTGMIGSFLVDVIMEKNSSDGLSCIVLGMCRDEKRAAERFGKHICNPKLKIMSCDVCEPLSGCDAVRADYVLHLASNTHPLQYSTDPIGTISTNIMGLKNLLDYTAAHGTARFLFASSNEVYGENRGDVELFDEEYCGYIDSNTLRAGYPESKRCGEALCQAYRRQKGMDVVIPRLTRTYGPTMLMNDTKAISQFIINALLGKDIVLKSSGEQYYSYQYVADSVAGLLTVLLCGENGQAYNIAEEHSDIMLKDLASFIADSCQLKVVYEMIPDAIESAGYSTATKARLDGRKLQKLGWNPRYDIRAGIIRTISILNSEYENNKSHV